MGRRVGPVDAAGQHRDGRPAGGEGAAMCGLVDAERGAGKKLLPGETRLYLSEEFGSARRRGVDGNLVAGL